MLVAHPSEKSLAQLDKRYLKTTITCSVQHICQYLGAKLNTTSDFQITLSKRGGTFILPKYLLLSDILKSVSHPCSSSASHRAT